jgi:hypothetical protein
MPPPPIILFVLMSKSAHIYQQERLTMKVFTA